MFKATQTCGKADLFRLMPDLSKLRCRLEIFHIAPSLCQTWPLLVVASVRLLALCLSFLWFVKQKGFIPVSSPLAVIDLIWSESCTEAGPVTDLLSWENFLGPWASKRSTSTLLWRLSHHCLYQFDWRNCLLRTCLWLTHEVVLRTGRTWASRRLLRRAEKRRRSYSQTLRGPLDSLELSLLKQPTKTY